VVVWVRGGAAVGSASHKPDSLPLPPTAQAAAERQLRELGQLHAGDAAAAAAADGGDEDGDAAAAAAGGGGGGSGGKDKEKEAKSKEGAKIKAARKEIMERAGECGVTCDSLGGV
jgi:hypothetical protein